MPKFEFMNRSHPSRHLEIEKAVKLFLDTKKAEKKSPRTLKVYHHELIKFAKWCAANGCDYGNKLSIDRYINFLTYEKQKWDDHPTSPTGEIGLSPRTINNTIRILKIFFNFLVHERYLPSNPIANMKYHPVEKNRFEIFTKDQIKALLAAPNKRTYTGYRDYVMMLVLLDTGLRIGELTSLKVSDIDFQLRQITVRWEIAKTNRTRIIPISEPVAKELHKLIEYCGLEPDDYLWLTQYGERYLAGQFTKMLKKYGKKAGITGVRVSPHTFRHTFATMYLLNGGDPFSLQKILGHTSTDTVSIYVNLTNTNVKHQHAVYSPITALHPQKRPKGHVRFK